MLKLIYNDEQAVGITKGLLKTLTYSPNAYEDLISVGRAAYFEAMRDFKKTKNTKFSTFAYLVIRRKLITYLNSLKYPCNNWILTSDIKVQIDGEDLDDDYYRRQLVTLPSVYDFGPDDEIEMLKKYKALFVKNWNLDYAQYRATRTDTLEKYWCIIIDRYNGLSYGDICKKYNLTHKALDNMITRLFRCMRRQEKPSDVFKRNQLNPKLKKKKKAQAKKTYDAAWYLQYGKRKNYRGLPEMI